MRTPNGEYPEYHSSADNLSLLRPERLAHSLSVPAAHRRRHRGDGVYGSRNQKGKPQLGANARDGMTVGQISRDQMALSSKT
jgi:aminopeptidase-like protein